MSALDKQIITMTKQSRVAANQLLNCKAQAIDTALLAMAKKLDSSRAMLKRENARDVDTAKKRGTAPAMIDRLTLKDKTIDTMIKGLQVVASLKAPLGTMYDKRRRPNGLSIYKVKVPIGVVGIIYEARPNVTVDAAAICLKSQNAVILRGGSEAFHSNMALCKLFADGCRRGKILKDAV